MVLGGLEYLGLREVLSSVKSSIRTGPLDEALRRITHRFFHSDNLLLRTLRYPCFRTSIAKLLVAGLVFFNTKRWKTNSLVAHRCWKFQLGIGELVSLARFDVLSNWRMLLTVERREVAREGRGERRWRRVVGDECRNHEMRKRWVLLLGWVLKASFEVRRSVQDDGQGWTLSRTTVKEESPETHRCHSSCLWVENTANEGDPSQVALSFLNEICGNLLPDFPERKLAPARKCEK